MSDSDERHDLGLRDLTVLRRVDGKTVFDADALPPDLRKAVETAKRPLDFDLRATSYITGGGDLEGYRVIDHETVGAIIEAIAAAKPALTLIEQRLMECRDALRWYADPENYEERASGSPTASGIYETTEVPILDDNGEMARAALDSPKEKP